MNRKLCLRFAIVLLATLLVSMSATAVEFADVSGHWAEEYVIQSADRALVQGYNGLYRPDDSMSRAELVTILWRSMGEPEPEAKASFTDLTQEWYKKPVAWAEENNVINGVGNGKFDPNGRVTREQLAVILHRMTGSPMGMEVMFTSIYDDYFVDEEQISAYAKSAIYWSVFEVVYCGQASVDTGNTLAPKADATRGQIAVMIIRYLDRNN